MNDNLPDYSVFDTPTLIVMRSDLAIFPADEPHLRKVDEILKERGLGFTERNIQLPEGE